MGFWDFVETVTCIGGILLVLTIPVVVIKRMSAVDAGLFDEISRDSEKWHERDMARRELALTRHKMNVDLARHRLNILQLRTMDSEELEALAAAAAEELRKRREQQPEDDKAMGLLVVEQQRMETDHRSLESWVESLGTSGFDELSRTATEGL